MRKPVDYDDWLDMRLEAQMDDDYIEVCKECGATEDFVGSVCQSCGTCASCGASCETVTRWAQYSSFPEQYELYVCDCEEED